ncbi:MAG: LexA family transcriptional regulator [Actinobacteria bacterium]|nr:LexA family transcriptional regulator [Actinomycetota bacterium]
MRSNSERSRVTVETTASFPNPAQDYYEGALSLDRHLVPRPTSTYVVRVASEALVDLGIHPGDELLVDRALDPRPGRVVVVVVEGERRLGRFELHGGAPVLVSDLGEIPLTAAVEPWGVATIVIHHLPLGPGDP